MKKTTYTISIYSENNVGLLNRVSAIFLKRHINIVSITSSESEIPDIFRFVIVVNISKEQVVKVVKQIEKQIEVISVFYHTDKQTIFLETALYKVKSSSLFEEKQIQNMIKDSRANIVTVKPDYFVIEKTVDSDVSHVNQITIAQSIGEPRPFRRSTSNVSFSIILNCCHIF